MGLAQGPNTGNLNLGAGVEVGITDGVDDAIILAAGADDVLNSGAQLWVGGALYVFDGTAWDRLRGTAADGALVNLGTNNDVTVTGTVTEASGAAIATSLAIMDDWDESDRAKTNPVVGQAGLAGGTGVDAANALRVSLATNIALPTGSNVIGQVTANAGTNLNTSTLLTTTAHDAAFGTAGSADAQVRTIQGVASMTPVQVVGSVAHDTGTPGSPVVIAGSAQSLDGTAPPNRVSTEADVTRLATDFEGAQFTHPHGVMIWNSHFDSAAAVQTDASIAGGDPGDGFAVFVTDLVFSIGAATASTVFLEEGATKIIGPYYLPATIGTGLSIHFVVPHRCTASTAVTVSTTGSIVYGLDVAGYIAAL